MLAIRDERLERAARLCGAFTAAIHGTEEVVDQRMRDEFFEPARDRYGHSAWDRACEQGTRMSLDTAIAYTLDEDEIASPQVR